MKRLLFLFSGIIFVGVLFAQNEVTTELLPPKIRLLPGQNQNFIFTNECAGFYFGQTAGENKTLAEGFNVETVEFLEDYRLTINGQALERNDASVKIYQDKLVRRYDDWNLTETVKLVPNENILMVKLECPGKTTISLYPGIPVENDTLSDAFISHWEQNEHSLFIARKRHLIRTHEEDYPVWLGITAMPEPLFVPDETEIVPETVSSVTHLYLPGRITFKIDSVGVILFMVGDYRDKLVQAKRRIEGRYPFLIEQRGFKIDRIWPGIFEKS